MTIAERLRQDAKQIGYQEGRYAGKAQGEHEKALFIAKKMLVNNFDHETVKKITGLSDSDLLKLLRPSLGN